jgi:hypothetical protein
VQTKRAAHLEEVARLVQAIVLIQSLSARDLVGIVVQTGDRCPAEERTARHASVAMQNKDEVLCAIPEKSAQLSISRHQPLDHMQDGSVKAVPI